MAKLKSGRLRREVSDACLQYWGGMGFTWDNPASRAYRDGRLGSIGGGRIVSVLCEDGQPVEYGQVLFEIDRG